MEVEDGVGGGLVFGVWWVGEERSHIDSGFCSLVKKLEKYSNVESSLREF